MLLQYFRSFLTRCLILGSYVRRIKRGFSAHVVLLSPQGRQFDQSKAKELSLKSHLVLICGRYEGIDQRVADNLVDEEISIGDFVLSGGEFAALVIVDSVSRLIPGAVSQGGSVLEESFMEGLLDYPHYTRPEDFQGWKVPSVLLSGDHQKIQQWRYQEAIRKTRRRRPDLLKKDAVDELMMFKNKVRIPN